VIEARGLTVRYAPAVLALEALDLRVAPGEIYAMVGAPGAGKTTLIGVLAGIVRASSGQALVCGVDTQTSPAAARRRAAFITATTTLHAHQSAARNVDFFAAVALGQRRLDPRAVADAMRRTAIPERCFDRPVSELSRAIEIRLLLAVALLRGTGALLLDDPISDLESQDLFELQECLRDFAAAGQSVLVTTSSPAAIVPIATRVGLLDHGRKTTERTAAEFAASIGAHLHSTPTRSERG
jgi:ABC-2 type transport system ATP-binding protein